MNRVALSPGRRRRLHAEVLIVLGLSLGSSAVYSVVSLINAATREHPLASQTTTLNRSLSERPLFDLVYQFLGIFFDLMPVALVAFLLWRSARPHLGRLGLDSRSIGPDAASGVGLAAIIGIPGLLLYLAGRSLGMTPNVVPTALDEYWWTVPILLLSAMRAAVTEEVIVVGYLFARLRELRWGTWAIILCAAALRGAYHLYQGVPAFLGNAAMGVLFGWLYSRYGRLLPLLVAHFVLDAAVFVGYPWAAATFPDLLG